MPFLWSNRITDGKTLLKKVEFEMFRHNCQIFKHVTLQNMQLIYYLFLNYLGKKMQTAFLHANNDQVSMMLNVLNQT